MTTKLHVACTDEHTAVAVLLTAGQRHDSVGFAPLYTQAQRAGTLVRLTADRAYDADAIRPQLASDAVESVIPARSNRVDPQPHSTVRYKLRHKVENWFRKLQDFRRLATRYEKLARCYLALVHLASSLILLRFFVNTP